MLLTVLPEVRHVSVNGSHVVVTGTGNLLNAVIEAAEQLRDDSGQWQRHVGQARKLARESLSEARRSVQALRPGRLEGSRLPEAVAQLAKEWSLTSGVPVRIEMTGAAVSLLPELEVIFFRVAQEGLTNVARHANATRVGLTLSYLQDMMRLDVRDDGVGFDVAVKSIAERRCEWPRLRPQRYEAAPATGWRLAGGRERAGQRNSHQRQRAAAGRSGGITRTA
jgi:signal transduction histidine kinase